MLDTPSEIHFKELHQLYCIELPAAERQLSSLQNEKVRGPVQFKSMKKAQETIKKSWEMHRILQQSEIICAKIGYFLLEMELFGILLDSDSCECKAKYYGHCRHRNLFEEISKTLADLPREVFDSVRELGQPQVEIDVAARLATRDKARE